MRRTPPDGYGPMLRAAREQAGLGLREAARRTGITASYAAKLERGVRCPSLVVAERLAALYGLEGERRAQLLAGAVDDAGRSHPDRATIAA
ncbi:helix-turn-helix transcriptional regulator [Streptomyces sp. PA03-6a]|nr:helix-turn-helix transcriptional regulator [Streptomyces sp. PA03-6a]